VTKKEQIMAEISVADAKPADIVRLTDAFRDWPKPAALFEHYVEQRHDGRIDLLVARRDENPVGYCLIVWDSAYPPFAEAGIPEISDLNVLPAHRGTGLGRLLLGEAEKRITTRAAAAGLRVGLYADYGIAQQMYARRGYLPDGRGVIIDGEQVPPGTMILLDDGPVLALVRTLR
jgi:GNAT superfamily N-acetyltransferase